MISAAFIYDRNWDFWLSFLMNHIRSLVSIIKYGASSKQSWSHFDSKILIKIGP